MIQIKPLEWTRRKPGDGSGYAVEAYDAKGAFGTKFTILRRKGDGWRLHGPAEDPTSHPTAVKAMQAAQDDYRKLFEPYVSEVPDAAERKLTDEQWREVEYNVNRKGDPDIPLWRIKEAVKYADHVATSAQSGETLATDPRTGRPIGDHGSAIQAIVYAVEDARSEIDTFLKNWLEGNLDEWPEFYKWLETDGAKELERLEALIPAPQTKTDGVGINARALAVEVVDAIHGYTYEFSHQQQRHLDEYDLVEGLIERTVAPAPQTKTEEVNGVE